LRDAEEEAQAAARRAEHEAEVVRHEHFRREVWLIARDCMLIATDCEPHQAVTSTSGARCGCESSSRAIAC
jgi:hypothetical protein